MQGEATRITLLVTQTLEQLGILYAVGGSLASSLHGVMRSTSDADIVADMKPDHIQPLVDALSKEFYADDEMMRGAIEHQSSFNLIHYETAFKVDIFIRKSRASIRCSSTVAEYPSLPPTLKKAFMSPALKILSLPNSNGITWAAKSRTGNGVISLGYSRFAQVNSTWNTCVNGPPNSVLAICWNAL